MTTTGINETPEIDSATSAPPSRAHRSIHLARAGRTVVGFALLVVGAALLVLPGPGLLVIIAGLAVLAKEYTWAQRLLIKARRRAEIAAGRARDRLRRRPG